MPQFGARRSTLRAGRGGGLVAVAVALLLGVAPASADPPAQVTDPVGDANFVNGQSVQPGYEHGPDTRPVSVDGADLVGVRFSTGYRTQRVLDAATGRPLRVEHHAEALVVQIQTAAPVRPISPWSAVQYKVRATLGACAASFELHVGANPANDRAQFVAVRQCGRMNPGNTAPSKVAPTFAGNVATLVFRFDDLNLSVSDGALHATARVEAPVAHVFVPGVSRTAGVRDPLLGTGVTVLPENDYVIVDQTTVGTTFTVGEDLPPDIDCVVDEQNPACAP